VHRGTVVKWADGGEGQYFLAGLRVWNSVYCGED
jgi:hypothetical protein